MDNGLRAKIERLGYSVSEINKDFGKIDPADRIGKLKCPGSLGRYCQELKSAVEGASKDGFVLTLGGDHSIAIGSVSGISSKHNDLFVVWVDAHADINTPETTETGNIHGCPVSFLCGVESAMKLPSFSWLSQTTLRPDSFVYIGLRDVDPPEKKILQELGMQTYSMHEIEQLGIANVMDKVLQMAGSRPIHVSFDVDALDPVHAASTGTPVVGGLTLREGRYICEKLHQSKRLVSMDLVEVNPLLGSEDDVRRTVASSCLLIEAALGADLLK